MFGVSYEHVVEAEPEGKISPFRQSASVDVQPFE
jgi:hypothetical protein